MKTGFPENKISEVNCVISENDSENNTGDNNLNIVNSTPFVYIKFDNNGEPDSYEKNSLEILKYNQNIPKIIDSFEYGDFHTKVILALGTTWILDGYEVTLLSVLSGVIIDMYNITDKDIGICGSVYLAGAVFGSLIFGSFSSFYGRKKLFNITLLIYIISVAAICLSFSKWNFFICRFFTGVAVGGEYSAIFSAIDELLPAYIRGRVDLIIDGTWHFGSCIASIAGVAVLQAHSGGQDSTFWIRALFVVGAIISLPVIYLRSFIPESPRWLLHNGQINQAVEITKEIFSKCKIRKDSFVANNIDSLNVLNDEIKCVNFKKEHITIKQIAHILFMEHPKRFFYALILMATQAFFYNGVFYTYTLVLKNFEGVSKEIVGIYLVPLSVASFLGPICIGHFFDTYSRRKMIFICNMSTFGLLVVLAFNFKYKFFSFALEQIFWFITFILASPGSSAAHLTVSEIFPVEMRSQALSFFFSIGYGTGGIIAPLIFGILIESKDRNLIFVAYLCAGLAMGISAMSSIFLGIDTERKSLEEITDDLKKNN